MVFYVFFFMFFYVFFTAFDGSTIPANQNPWLVGGTFDVSVFRSSGSGPMEIHASPRQTFPGIFDGCVRFEQSAHTHTQG